MKGKNYKPSDTLLQVVQEISFAKALAGNDKTIRDKALKKLKLWLIKKSEGTQNITEEGYIRIWRGLFYNIWMSDKPLIQEEVVENISQLVHCFNTFSGSIDFVSIFFRILSDFWFGLDSHRFDKYLMFVRRFVRQSLLLVANKNWNKDDVVTLVATFKKGLENAPLGLIMHITEIYLEELAKVSKGRLNTDILFEFIKPFGEIMSISSDQRIINHINDNIYMYLLKQSDLGIKHEVKFRTWKKMGCPEGNINVLQEVKTPMADEEMDYDDDIPEGSLDARAGKVDVILPTLKFDENSIINHLTSLKKKSTTTTKARKCFNDILNKYKRYAHGKFPLGIHKVPTIDSDYDFYEVIENKAFELLEEETELQHENKKEKSLKIKRKLKKFAGEWTITPTSELPEEHSPNDKDLNLSSCSNSNTTWEISNSVTELKDDNKIKKKKKKKQNKNKLSEKLISEVTNGVKKSPSVKSNKSDSTRSPNNAKKVEFVLERNSIQDENDYRKSLKKNPVINTEKKIQPPGVLKSSPFSSPINPFKISAGLELKFRF